MAAPTAVEAERLKALPPEVDRTVNAMRELLTKTIPELNVRLATRPKISVQPMK